MEFGVGSIVEGKVTGITKFGAFVALPEGKSGLVHISEIAYTYVNDVKDHLKEGQEVKVKVIGIDENGRINLSIRKINVTAPYQDIPEHLDIDVTSLQLGKSIKVGDLHFDGLELATPADVIVCSVKATRASRSAAAAEAAGN